MADDHRRRRRTTYTASTAWNWPRTPDLFDLTRWPMILIIYTLVAVIADQQLVEIAKALSFDARVLVMDEPTAALSGVEVERCSRSRAAARRAAPRCCSSRTASTRSSRSASGSPSCATAPGSSTDPIDELTVDDHRAAHGRPRRLLAVPQAGRRSPARSCSHVTRPDPPRACSRRHLRGARRRDRRAGRPGRRRSQRGGPGRSSVSTATTRARSRSDGRAAAAG